MTTTYARTRLAVCMFLLAALPITAAHAEEQLKLDAYRDHLSLNGEWSKLANHPDLNVTDANFKSIEGWQPTAVPGLMMAHRKRSNSDALKADCYWLRRSFELTETQAARDVVLKWNGIRYGATAWINGKHITTHPTMGPHTALIPRGVVQAGQNEIVIRVTAWNSIPKAAALGRNPIRFTLIPTGASICSWGSKVAAVFDDVYLEFYDRAYMKWALAVPDIKNGKVTFRVRLDGAADLPKSVKISAVVRPVGDDGKPAGAAKVTAATAGKIVNVTVSVNNPKLWTPQTPNMYEAELELRDDADGKKLCDTLRFRFGMREIRVVDGRYKLNGKPVWFRGSSLVKEWQWGEPFQDMNFVKRYLVDEARVANANCFRTHTGPLPTSWADLADENGIMILAEMPVLRNYMDFPWTKAEYDEWHKNVLIDAPGWITKLWNHPSVVMWVLSNETLDSKWENEVYREMVLKLDPTRPTMRSGHQGENAGTKDNLDMHPCSNLAKGPEGWFNEVVARYARERGDRTLTNTEYMNRFGSIQRMRRIWTGSEADNPQNDIMWAQAGAEHTEVMRRLQFDLIQPYMWAWFSGVRRDNFWRDGYSTPYMAAWQSSFSPVLASLDLFDRNFVTGQTMSTPLHLINDLHEDTSATLDVYLTIQDPLLIPDAAAIEGAVWHRQIKRTLVADSIKIEPLEWTVPAKPGTYYLAVVLRRDGARPVVSQRKVRAIAPVNPAARLAGKKILVLGADPTIEKWLKAAQVNVVTDIADATVAVETRRGKSNVIEADAILLWDIDAIDTQTLAKTGLIHSYVKAGGRMTILHQPAWTWKEMNESLRSRIKESSFEYRPEVNNKNMFSDTVLVWRLDAMTSDTLERSDAIDKFIKDGGRMQIAVKQEWTWNKLLNFEISRRTDWINGRASRVFPYKYVNHPALEGIDPDSLKRWNSLPGLISDASLSGEAIQLGTKILWQERPGKPVMLAVPFGEGEMIISLLHLKQRISAGSDSYDPIAERMLVNLLAGPTMAEDATP